MLGNMLEACHIWYDLTLDEPTSDPFGPLTETLRAYRGGGVWHEARYIRAAQKFSMPQDFRGLLGIRPVRTLP